MRSSIGRRRFLRRGMLAAGAAAPLAALAGASPAAAAGSRSVFLDESASYVDAGPAPRNLGGSLIAPAATLTGVQFTGTLAAGQIGTWSTHSWPAGWHVIWHAVSTTTRSGVLQVQTDWAVGRQTADLITYWIAIHNLSNATVNIEARYAILNQG